DRRAEPVRDQRLLPQGRNSDARLLLEPEVLETLALERLEVDALRLGRERRDERALLLELLGAADAVALGLGGFLRGELAVPLPDEPDDGGATDRDHGELQESVHGDLLRCGWSPERTKGAPPFRRRALRRGGS